jgi:hypothetical protein
VSETSILEAYECQKSLIYTRTSWIRFFFFSTSPLKAPNRLKSLKLAWRFILTSCDIYQNTGENFPTDIQKALTANSASCDISVKTTYHSVFGKLTAMWNTCSRSTKASDEIERTCKRKLCVPCTTRWNSVFESVVAI